MDLHQAAADPGFRGYLTDLLLELCRHDTSIRADVDALRENEHKVFAALERELGAMQLPGARLERKPINPAIAKHPFFSQLYYTKRPDRPQGLTVEQNYRDRFNLLLMIDGDQKKPAAGKNQAINGHIDVVAPYFPPRLEGDKVFGRGSCDDKGNLVAMIGGLRLLAQFLKANQRKLNKNFTGMFVIEEEMGGNGSLSLAIDRELRQRYDSLVVMEICDNRLFPGNRGAVWYMIEGKLPDQLVKGVNLFEAAAFAVEEMEKEGRALKAESNHPLFPHRPVQTCHGVIGNSGEHPSRINGDVTFEITPGSTPGTSPGRSMGAPFSDAARTVIEDVVNDAVVQYTGLYGDKTKVIDPNTNKPKVDHHYDLKFTESGATVRVWGATGHMGSILVNDGAITKMATIVRALVRSRAAIAKAAGIATQDMSFHLANWQERSHLLMEGGQGFLPTHSLDQVQSRLQHAVWRGLENYFALVGKPIKASDHFAVTFEKLHNAAFAGKADSPDMQTAIACAKLAGTWKDADYAQGIRGWDVSCDSRIFACEYPDLPVITTGPGSLTVAHSDTEHIVIDDMVKSALFLAYYVLKQTGTAE